MTNESVKQLIQTFLSEAVHIECKLDTNDEVLMSGENVLLLDSPEVPLGVYDNGVMVINPAALDIAPPGLIHNASRRFGLALPADYVGQSPVYQSYIAKEIEYEQNKPRLGYDGLIYTERWVEVAQIDEDGKRIPDRPFKIYTQSGKQLMFEGRTDRLGVSEHFTMLHAFRRVVVEFLEDETLGYGQSRKASYTERVVEVELVRVAPNPDNEEKVNDTEGCSIWVICEGEENISKALLAIDDRMKKKLKGDVYNMGRGHSMTYHEAVWLWRNGNGTPVIVDGDMLKAGWVPILGTTVLPLPLDETKVFGHVETNPDSGSPFLPYDKRIYFDTYDFDVKTPAGWYDVGTHFRNFLNQAAIDEHGKGTPYEIQIRYEDEFFN